MLAFADFQLVPVERRLLRAGVAVRVGSRSLDILIALIARKGEIMTKDELIEAVWPNITIEESALRVHMSTLRRALGDGEGDVRLITNVPGRGYCFVAPVTVITEEPALVTVAVSAPSSAMSRLPAQVSRIIGRDALIAELVETVRDRRLVSLVGPGGMGKTTVAVAVAHRLGDAGYEVAFVDLASVVDPELVPGAVASALGLAVRSFDLVQEIVEFLEDRRFLLVLDSCEHVIDSAATLAEAVLGRAGGLTVLATSREALRADDEWVHRLQPLTLPPESAIISAEEALAYSAVQMFVTRASSVLGGYRLTDLHAPIVAEICRRLDGIALAIELATGRLDGMSVEALAKSLENCFQVLTRGRRTALARHQTLRGTIDWSFGILPECEQALLRRLAVFNGAFTLDAVDHVAGETVDDSLLNLVAKSLLVAEVGPGEARYRMMDTTRGYALEKLEAAGEAADRRRRHAVYYRDLFAGGEADWVSRPDGGTDFAGLLGNLRAALDWSFSEQGDGTIGVALTADAVPLWFQLSLVDECLGRVQAALIWLESSPSPDQRVRMRLYAGLGFPQMRAITGFPSGVAAWRSVLEIAEAIGDTDYQARASWALWTDRINTGESREALIFAERLAALSRKAPQAVSPLIAQRVRGWSRLMLGDLDGAHADIDGMLRTYGPAARNVDVARFQYDQRSTARITLARTLWLLGRPDQALREVEDNIAEVTAAGHTLSLAHVLSDAACFVALWRGDLDLAEAHTALLRKHTGLQALDVWRTYGDCFEGEILIRRGDPAAGIPLLRAGIAQLEAAGFVCYHTAFLGVLAESLTDLGIIETALAQCGRTGEAWALPELLRIKGEILLRLDRRDEAEACFMLSLERAVSQNALAWELRTAISWTRASGVPARQRLASAVGRFREGFDSVDLRSATTLLGELGD